MWTWKRFFGASLAATSVVVLAASVAGAAGTPQQQCQATKNKEAGKYVACRHKAEAKLATTGDTVTYSLTLQKCDEKWTNTWGKADMKAWAAGGSCLDWPLTMDDFTPLMERNADAFATALGGGGLVRYTFPPSGQTTSYGTYSDGNVAWGHQGLRYRDNGDGTITDENTGLMWEKKSNDGGIHDVDNTYTWGMTTSPYTMNGTIVTSFLWAGLNSGSGFAGYTDWRIPNVKELQSIVNYQIAYPGPTVSSEFNTGCAPGCTVLTCSCTAAYGYWSSTTNAITPNYAWYVNFDNGLLLASTKSTDFYVRGVRGGS